MRRGCLISPRRSIFIGVEGPSDRAFVKFLGMWCERKGKHLHLDVKPASGGDSVAVVKYAVRYLSNRSFGKEFIRKFVLLDEDRIQQDKRAGRDAHAVASKHGLGVVLQTPNLEGLLLRLHQGHERHRLQARNAKAKLEKLWPEYDKSLNSDQLDQRFDLNDLRRAAKYDEHLQRLLTILEIGGK